MRLIKQFGNTLIESDAKLIHFFFIFNIQCVFCIFLRFSTENRQYKNAFPTNFVYAAHFPSTIFIPSRANVQGVNS